jgi:hypothetical protein
MASPEMYTRSLAPGILFINRRHVSRSLLEIRPPVEITTLTNDSSVSSNAFSIKQMDHVLPSLRRAKIKTRGSIVVMPNSFITRSDSFAHSSP